MTFIQTYRGTKEGSSKKTRLVSSVERHGECYNKGISQTHTIAQESIASLYLQNKCSTLNKRESKQIMEIGHLKTIMRL